MASKTDKTEMKRLKRNKRMGGKRKAKLRTAGSTQSPADLFGDKK